MRRVRGRVRGCDRCARVRVACAVSCRYVRWVRYDPTMTMMAGVCGWVMMMGDDDDDRVACGRCQCAGVRTMV